MKSSVLLLLVGISLAFAGKHSLKYFYTSVSGDNNFTATGLVDDIQFMYFDINTKKASPKTEWVREIEESDYWDSQTHSLIEQHHWILNNIWTESAGEHTYQITYGCEWKDETGKTNAFHQYGYDGEDFLFLDLKRDEWISPMKQGFKTQERCNNETIRLVHWKYYLEIDCIETLKKLLTIGKSSLEKTVSPQVSLLQKNSSSPVLCHVTHFYPSDITITWMRNGQELYKNVKVGKVLPNEDSTFQKTVILQTEADEWRKNEFSCVVKHQSKTFRKTLTEKEIRTNYETSALVGIIVAFVSVVIESLLLSMLLSVFLLITAVLQLLVYQWILNSAGGDESLDDDDILSLTSSDPAVSALLAASPREQEMAVEEEGGEPAGSSKPPCPTAHVAAGQAGAALHTMAVLQAYQADLLKDLDQGQGLSPEAVE
ncbi:DLA class I histocompatibility antigen, A9/A9 alpha chain-like [Megalobrama amblycephala]|uniref:DLA class I histocompatibility antigen, A9/A9 alpha chain-like n=1 Tax=Megalobrama amblycephala TaxID=75352 RepID=UPI00201472E5|nr:DLA class I histocompatibility antigen, A9/A9 alpha chain-like [Megalobrama amblycephala]